MTDKISWLLAVLAGAFLACMLFLNGLLASSTSPTWASFVAHVLGAVAAALLVLVARTPSSAPNARAPAWAYLAGIPGALTVVLANTTVNTTLGLTGTLSLMLLGQVVFASIVDSLGLFQLKRRNLGLYDFAAVLLIMTGTAVLIFFAR